MRECIADPWDNVTSLQVCTPALPADGPSAAVFGDLIDYLCGTVFISPR
jgi:hypothetical protein